MKTFDLNINNIVYYEGRNTTGEIYFSSGDQFFPGERWDDFIEVVLNWWCEALIELYSSNDDTAELSFMDGPKLMRIRISPSDSQKWELTGVDRFSLVEIFATTVGECEFLQILQKAVNKTLLSGLNNNQTEEYVQLKKNYIRIQDIVKRKCPKNAYKN